MNDLSAQFWELDSKVGTHINTIVQPIQLWSIVVPKESLPVLQKTLYTNDIKRYHPKRDHLFIAGLRKMLRSKKCPPIDPNANYRFIRKNGVEVLPIGIKEDKTIHSEFNCEGL